MSVSRFCQALAALFLLLQIAGIGRILFTDERFFAWAPHDSRIDVQVTATHNGEEVNQKAIQNRYRLPTIDWHAWGNVKAVIRTAEERQPLPSRWQVQVLYKINLAEPKVWLYPPVESTP